MPRVGEGEVGWCFILNGALVDLSMSSNMAAIISKHKFKHVIDTFKGIVTKFINLTLIY